LVFHFRIFDVRPENFGRGNKVSSPRLSPSSKGK
jgi:hypothetical protein